MEAGEFADWLSGIGRLSDEQIALALTELGAIVGRSDDVGLRPSPEAGPEGELSTEGGERRKARIERDALATIGERKVERLGCAHCGADQIVGWGRSHGLPRYRYKACGRTFNAATDGNFFLRKTRSSAIANSIRCAGRARSPQREQTIGGSHYSGSTLNRAGSCLFNSRMLEASKI